MVDLARSDDPAGPILITRDLELRRSQAPDYLSEKLALQDLAHHMADHPAEVLPRLVKLALELCEADSAGVSVLEGSVFRWYGLVGKLAVFEGATTPRNSSPCGVCLDQCRAILMKNPERAYSWIADAQITVPEVLLVPLLKNGKEPIGTLWIVAKENGDFNAEHSRVMGELATFTGVALHMIQADHLLNKALEQQETLAREMSHRVKNVFAVTNSMIAMSAASARTKEELAAGLTGRLTALSNAHGLVRRTFSEVHKAQGASLTELVRTILRPYRTPELQGEDLFLGERATNGLALVLHELATNAAKYGAFSNRTGAVAVAWKLDGVDLVLTWQETGGPEVAVPEREGFGSKLVQATISSHDGDIEHDWKPGGLIARIRVPAESLKS